MSTAVSLVRAVLAVVQRADAKPDAVLERAAIARATVDDREARVPTARFLEVLRAAAELTGRLSIGADVARAMDGEAFGVLGFVVASCSDLREALLRFSKFTRLLCDELRFELVVGATSAKVVYELAGFDEPALFELAETHLVLTARRGTKGLFRPTELCFRHTATPRELAEVAGAPVRFGAPRNEVVFAPSALDLKLRGGNKALLSILDKHAEQVLAALPREDDVLSVVRVAIQKLLDGGEPSLAAAAQSSGLGTRTLQRRLLERGVTFRALVDDVRREIAVAELERGGASVTEIAFALGFSGPSAFHHAFRRWTGRSPTGRA